MAARYQVIGHCAHATTRGSSGRVRQLFFKGQLLPEDTPGQEIRHLLSVNLIKPVGAPATPTVSASAAQPVTDTPVGQPTLTEAEITATAPANPATDTEVEAKRAAARAKLPTDGSRPDGRAAQAVWVEYLVTKGYSYDAVVNEPKATLMELANNIE